MNKLSTKNQANFFWKFHTHTDTHTHFTHFTQCLRAFLYQCSPPYTFADMLANCKKRNRGDSKTKAKPKEVERQNIGSLKVKY